MVSLMDFLVICTKWIFPSCVQYIYTPDMITFSGCDWVSQMTCMHQNTPLSAWCLQAYISSKAAYTMPCTLYMWPSSRIQFHEVMLFVGAHFPAYSHFLSHDLCSQVVIWGCRAAAQNRPQGIFRLLQNDKTFHMPFNQVIFYWKLHKASIERLNKLYVWDVSAMMI